MKSLKGFTGRLLKQRSADQAVLEGALRPDLLQPRATFHHGVPPSARALAYDPTQRVLAVGTSDGRIKLLGGNSIELLLVSPRASPTRELLFVPGTPRLVRTSYKGEMEVWDTQTRELIASIGPTAGTHGSDISITAVSNVRSSRYMWVGDQCGAVRVVAEVMGESRMHVCAYDIWPSDVGDELLEANEPAVVELLPHPLAEDSRLLIGWEDGAIVLWAVAGRSPLAKRRSVGGSGGPAMTALCWAAADGERCAAGYENGEILLWSLPPVSSTTMATAVETIPLQCVRVGGSGTAAPVKALGWCGEEERVDGHTNDADDKYNHDEVDDDDDMVGQAGHARNYGAGGRLYVLGGRGEDDPEGVSAISLDGSRNRRDLHWYGDVVDFALVRPLGASALAPVESVIVLSSGGQLRVHDEFFPHAVGAADHPPLPLVPVVQEQAVAASQLYATTGGDANAAYSGSQRGLDKKRDPLPSGSVWPITGGDLPALTPRADDEPRSVMVTGLSDGSVKFYDASELRLPLVALHVCAESGLMVVAYRGGDARLFQFSQRPRAIACQSIVVDDSLLHATIVAEEGGESPQACSPGWQTVLRVLALPSAAVCLSLTSGFIALGCESGHVVLIDYINAKLMWAIKPIPSLVLAVVIAGCTPVDSTPTPTTAKGSPHPNITAPYSVFMSCAGVMHPKQQSVAVCMLLLDEHGLPVRTHLNHKVAKPTFAWVKDINSTTSPTSSGRGYDHEGEAAPVGAEVGVSSPTATNNAMSALHAFYANPTATPSPPAPTRTPPKPPTPHDTVVDMEDEDEDEDEGDDTSTCWDAPAYLLLCTQDAVRLYSPISLLRGERASLRKELLDKPPMLWASPFSCDTSSGLVYIDRSGQLAIRRLPDLALLKQISLPEQEGWRSKLAISRAGAHSSPSCCCDIDGQVVLVGDGGELLRISLLAGENKLRLPDALPSMHDPDLAVAAAAARKFKTTPKPISPAVSVSPARTDITHMSPLRGSGSLGSGDIRSALSPSASGGSASGSDIDAATTLKSSSGKKKGFSLLDSIKDASNLVKDGLANATQVPISFAGTAIDSLKEVLPFTPHDKSNSSARTTTTTPSIPQPLSDHELTIIFSRPIYRQSHVPTASTAVGAEGTPSPSTSGRGFTSPYHTPPEKSQRSELFAGASASSASSSGASPGESTIDAIRAKYGRPRKTDGADALGHTLTETRNRLHERGERLQARALDAKTAEMQNDAVGFADAARQLAAKMENRKWWQL
eukprot:jgi/Chlat1/3010/Chrsp201S03268